MLTNADEERRQLDQYTEALRWVAERIDPEAAEWIESVSRVNELHAAKPGCQGSVGCPTLASSRRNPRAPPLKEKWYKTPREFCTIRGSFLRLA